jgi:cyclic lactone autoinducer peptide
MKSIKKYIMKYSSVIAGLAILVTKMNVSSNCLFVLHQPKLPEGAKKLRNF